MKRFRITLIATLILVLVFGSIAFAANGENNGSYLRMGEYFRGVFQEWYAKFLGIDMQTLQLERQEGKSLNDIATEQGIDQEEFFNAALEQRTQYIDNLLLQGKITQDQAILLNSQAAIKTKAALEKVSPGTCEPIGPQERSYTGKGTARRGAR